MNQVKIDTIVRSSAIALLAALAGASDAAQAQPVEAHSPAPVSASASANEGPPASGVVNLNTATVEELTRLPGVGPTRAQAIVELRTRLKGFKKVEDIMRVRGVGRKTFRKLRPMLRLQGPTTLVEPRKSARSPAGTPRLIRAARAGARSACA